MNDLRATARRLAETMQCRCDLDRWQPTPLTGHSHVCPIHKAAVAATPSDLADEAGI